MLWNDYISLVVGAAVMQSVRRGDRALCAQYAGSQEYSKYARVMVSHVS